MFRNWRLTITTKKQSFSGGYSDGKCQKIRQKMRRTHAVGIKPVDPHLPTEYLFRRPGPTAMATDCRRNFNFPTDNVVGKGWSGTPEGPTESGYSVGKCRRKMGVCRPFRCTLSDGTSNSVGIFWKFLKK